MSKTTEKQSMKSITNIKQGAEGIMQIQKHQPRMHHGYLFPGEAQVRLSWQNRTRNTQIEPPTKQPCRLLLYAVHNFRSDIYTTFKKGKNSVKEQNMVKESNFTKIQGHAHKPKCNLRLILLR